MIDSSDYFLTYLREVEDLLTDPAVSEIMIRPVGTEQHAVFYESGRQFFPWLGDVPKAAHLEALGNEVARKLARRELCEEKPSVSATLDDGTRVAILHPSVAGGYAVTIRKFIQRVFSVQDLIERGNLPEEYAGAVEHAISIRKNILISGPNGSGKTTMMNSLASCYIPTRHSVITVEDRNRELYLPNHPNKLQLYATEHRPMVRLIPDALRHRISTILVGEVIDEAAFALLTALNTGHSGSIATIHANSAAAALPRLADCAMLAGGTWTKDAICQRIFETIHLVLHMENLHAVELVEVEGYDGGNFQTAPVSR